MTEIKSRKWMTILNEDVSFCSLDLQLISSSLNASTSVIAAVIYNIHMASTFQYCSWSEETIFFFQDGVLSLSPFPLVDSRPRYIGLTASVTTSIWCQCRPSFVSFLHAIWPSTRLIKEGIASRVMTARPRGELCTLYTRPILWNKINKLFRLSYVVP